MDGTRFDALSRALAATSNRRSTLRGIAAVVLGGGAAGLVASDSVAAGRTCRIAGQKCVGNRQCCSGVCDTARTTPRARRNRCTCGDLASCGSACIDTQTSHDHCGACNHACGADWVCIAGDCTCEGETTCDGACCNNSCVDLDTDADNCGACGNSCGANHICSAGKCYLTCTPPATGSGDCGNPTACMIDSNGNVYNIDNWSTFDGEGCGDEGGAACPAGQVCRVGWNPSYDPRFEIRKDGSGRIGDCVTYATCTP